MSRKIWSIIIVWSWVFIAVAALETTAQDNRPGPSLNTHMLVIPAYGSLTVDYPEGWLVDETAVGALSISNSMALLIDKSSTDLQPGEVFVTITAMPRAEWDAPVIESDRSVYEIAGLLYTVREGTAIQSEGVVESVSRQGFEAAGMTLASPDYQAMVRVVDIEDAVAVIEARTLPGSFDDFEETLTALMDGITFIPAGEGYSLTEPYSVNVDGGSITFNLPSGWQSDEHFASAFIANTHRSLMTFSQGVPFDPGIFAGALSMMTDLSDYGPDPTVADIIIPYAESFGMSAVSAEFLTIGERSAARLPFEGDTSDGVFLLMEIDPLHFMAVYARTSKGDLAAYEPVLWAILQTITFEPVGDI